MSDHKLLKAAEAVAFNDLGARFVACRRWRWKDRMLDDRGRTVLCVGAGRIDGIPVEWCSANAGHFEDYESPERAKEAWGIATPDTTDPATLGCILALVRDAWGNPTIHTQASGPFWIVVAGAGWSGDDLTGEQDGEAAALLAALEAAP